MTTAAPHWPNPYADLGPAFARRVDPTPLPEPRRLALNHPLAHELGLSSDWLTSDDALQVLTGCHVPTGMRPVASVYSGHQFGQWAGQLGDGRALLLGSLTGPTGPQEVQLKGAGPTPYSRRGDGRAVLRSSVREFLASEAMHGLGIPTTRALSLTGSDAPVYRETVESAAVVARTAPSFVRFGHFEHFSHHGLHNELRTLADWVIAQHFADCADAPNPYAALLAEVTRRTADLLASWQAVGFCHGVMNTDNMSLLGLTLDYGPFQFMDGFDPGHICNHSDTSGRYAYARQPNVAYWNLFCLAQALLPLLDDTQQAMDAVEPFKQLFPHALQTRMGAKLGLSSLQPGDDDLVEDLLQLMAAHRTDYTLTFWHLTQGAQAYASGPAVDTSALTNARDLFPDRAAFDAWAARWHARLQAQAGPDLAAMQRANPAIVLRNHLAHTAIEHLKAGDSRYFDRLWHALQNPFVLAPEHSDFAALPPAWSTSLHISCSS